jgi:hypothetical protein
VNFFYIKCLVKSDDISFHSVPSNSIGLNCSLVLSANIVLVRCGSHSTQTRSLNRIRAFVPF